ncbi:hypothetical protein [Cellulomonas palmilytica]|uniref:hypothetical protein n=1 Tax=Cellulomonas palmilytica TaxID=2608402 RepID=UPI001F3DE39D|nr:hypothetical protein [Cellulomonas palmilytica]UJP39345.1 hypothetical protein F1D97_13520 [Cellulomonas palmilytica]
MTRPSTPPTRDPETGATRFRVHRMCNGCDSDLGDATDDELMAAVSGAPLPDVRAECGCSLIPGTRVAMTFGGREVRGTVRSDCPATKGTPAVHVHWDGDDVWGADVHPSHLRTLDEAVTS